MQLPKPASNHSLKTLEAQKMMKKQQEEVDVAAAEIMKFEALIKKNLQAKESASKTGLDTADHTITYGIVLDAGSSHTNLYIYKWPAEKENDTGVVYQIEECKLKGPGISKYAHKINDLETYLIECMEKSRNVVPKSLHQETPVYLGATAGMRLLRMENEQLAQSVLEKVSSSLSNYPFDFQGAKIITGQEEGAYGWITINYLLGKFTQVSSNGILEDSCFHLGYEKFVNVSELYKTPCTKRFEKTLPFDQFQIQGIGNYQQCRQSILELFNTSYCPYSQCAFNGIFLPPLQGDFGAFSAFYFVMDFLNLTSKEVSSQQKMNEIMEKYCSRPWEEVSEQDTAIALCPQ
ncbi:Ectonucleoside triphosphate diphosphohydrolase 1 [Heterocephalus glaber]|uniref:Ectonucleoside triphosphate diphosphohydrolase 1 n=1 Tax=Heterocephalus glaber TaxID=10181 RepID=G5CAY6_HETGA|nr:Ectonucleoside triphosphate diphosphohydrolase 1 [Heterocephalus glaber]